VRLPDQTLNGAFCGVDETGALVLQLADGEKTTIHAGDVFFLE
jgi:biotin-(acetyl-CoA carboxylase) ligase